MAAAPVEFRVRRILLAVDPMADAMATLEAGTRLAAQLEAELAALFVEDINLVRCAELPFVRRASPSSPTWQSFDLAAMEEEMRRLAERMRRALAAQAERNRLVWSFRVVRGRPDAEALAAAADADLVILPAPGAGIGSRARAAAMVATCSVLLARPSRAPESRVVAAYDGTPGAERALAAAARLAGGGALKVLLLAEDREAAAEMKKRARALLAGWGVAAEFAVLARADAERLCRAAEEADAALVVSADSPVLAGEAAVQRLERAECAVLLVR